MKNNSRTENAIKNTKITIFCHIVFLLCSFICRTVFTKKMGAEYLGVSGLFSNILTILSFAELGIGSTLVYRLYKPFAKNDYNKINLYVKLYKKIYSIIIIIIFTVGIFITPFLKYLVDAPNIKENIILIYLLYLSHTLASYLFVYKKTLLTANQKDYIVSLFNELFNLIMNIMQCLVLIFFKDYIIYLIISIVCAILSNISCSLYVDKKYKFLKNSINDKLSKEEVKELKKDTKGLMMTKIASTAFSGTDNVFISTFIGIKYVGILSNYTLILQTINTLMNKIFSSITASIGNMVVSKESEDKTESVIFKMFFINAAMYSYICIGLALLIKEFVTEYWLDYEYYLSDSIVLLAIFELYLRSIHYPLYTVRNAIGLFSQCRFIVVILALLNILLDFILVKPLGIAGLIIATIISRGIAYVVDIHVVYKYGLKKSPKQYYLNLFKWLGYTTLCYIIISSIFKYFKTFNLLYFIIKIIIITTIYLLLFIVFYKKSDELIYYIDLIKKRVLKKVK